MASLALAVAGAGIGAAIAPAGAAMLWAQTGYAIGSIAGSLLFPAKGQKVEGPRLQDLQIQSSAEGAPIAQTYGSMRIAGNAIWGKPLSEHRHKEKSGGKGGGGGATSITYTYTADFAVALCEGPIDAVRKIWADGKLIYDVSEPTAAEQAIADGGGYLADRVAAQQASLEKTVKGGGTMRIYLGSETQLPDPLIEADLGAGNAPAFRGTAYLLFDNLALEDFGNRLPNITVEVVTGTSGVAYLGKQGPFQFLTMPPSVAPGDARYEQVAHYISADRVVLAQTWAHSFASNALVSADVLNVYPSGAQSIGGRTTGVYGHAGDMGPVPAYCDTPAFFTHFGSGLGVRAVSLYDADVPTVIGHFRGVNNDDFSYLDNVSSSGVWYTDGTVWVILGDDFHRVMRAEPVGAVLAPIAFITMSVVGRLNDIIPDSIISSHISEGVCYTVAGSSNPLSLYQVNLDTFSVESVTPLSGVTIDTGGTLPSARLFREGNRTYVLSRPSSSEPSIGYVENGVYHLIGSIPNFPFGVNDVASANNFAVSEGLLIIHQKAGASVVTYAPPAVGFLYYWSLSAVGVSSVPLSTIISNICIRAGLQSEDINVTDLASVNVKGYLRANQMTARAAIEPLAQAYRFDATESDGVLKFVRRGTASVATLTVDDFALAGEQDGPHVTTLQQDNELPIELTVRYMDVDRDYQSGAQRARRLAPDSQQTMTVELPVVLHGDEAKQSAEVLQYLAWTERTKYQFSLTPKHIKLDAGDIVTAPIGGADRRLRLTQVTLADVLACEAVADDASVYVSAAEAAATTSAQQTISTPGTTIPAFLDIPILRDADDDADFYLGAVGTGSGWTGAAVYKSADRADWARIDAVTEPSTIGTCTTLLPTGPTTVFDDGSTVTVRLIAGTLSSVTEAQMCNGANAAAIGSMSGGWEIVGFQNAILQGDGTYLLSRFLRGRRGTEWAVGTHAIGDQFVLLEEGDLIRPNTAATEINSPRYYRLPSFGTQLVDASEITYTHQAIGKKPLSPVHISGRRHAPSTNDWTVSWVRRGRLDWEWRDYVETPLGEASESYEIDIMSGSTVKRTLTATTQSVTYTAAQQTTDFGAVQTTLSVRVYQISATVGRGYAGTATL